MTPTNNSLWKFQLGILGIFGLIIFTLFLNATAYSIPTTRISRPNIVFIRTDDDVINTLRVLQPNGTPVLKNIQELLQAHGTTFANNYVSLSLCCPSRATTLTGQYAHNHHVKSNSFPTGGYQALDNNNTLPVWLQANGYYNSHIGKYLNGYTGTLIPPGWNDWHTVINTSGGTHYYNYQLNENGVIHAYGTDANNYASDVFTNQAVHFLATQPNESQPFFLQVDYTAPHSGPILVGGYFEPPTPAPRHLGIMNQYQPVLPPSYNEMDVSDKPIVIRNLAPLNALDTNMIIENEKARLGTMLAVDEGVKRIMDELRLKGELANTYIIFTSDNGYQQGEHRIPEGKEWVYTESNQQYLVIRGPGVIPGQVRNEVVGNIDLAPTIVEWTHTTPGLTMDGDSLNGLLTNPSTTQPSRNDILLEDWYGGNPYKAIQTPDYLYAEYDYNSSTQANEIELYTLTGDACHGADPYELESQHANPCENATIAQLHAQLMALQNCVGTNQCG